MSTSYRAIRTLLEESRQQLREVPTPVRLGETLEWLRQLRFAEIKAADAACEEFAVCQRWPEVRIDSVVAQIRVRIASAISLCRSLEHKPPPDGMSPRELLRMILLEYWHGKVTRLLKELPALAPDTAAKT